MKKIVLSLLSITLLALVFNSCVKDTDYETPQMNCSEPEIDTASMTDIAAVLANWHALNPAPNDRNVLKFAAEDADPVYLTGYVVSNDKTGNFYKELFIQDALTNPQHAVKLAIDQRSLFTRYDMGRKLYVKLNGMGLNKVHGEYVIGWVDGSDVSPVREHIANKNILRSCTPGDVQPKLLNSPNDITDDMIGMYVQFDHMQFDLSEIGKTFVDPADSYDTHRLMKSCADDSELKLETSTFASFKDVSLPEKAGSVKGIISRNYGDDFYVLRVNSPEDFDFNGNRCDPAMLDCHGTNVGGNTVLFNEDFSSYSTGETNIPGWTNVNINGGSTLFKVGSYQGNKFMKCSAYNSGEDPLEVWLITPAIDLDSSTGEELTFKTLTGYNNGQALSVYVSTDFNGDINNATWLLVDTTLADGPSSGYGSWVDGSADISCLSGNVYVAFRYKGGESGITTTFEVDDVKVSAN